MYRRGGSYERLGNYEKSDEDLLHALRIRPDDAYVLNYLAYSWLERDYKIDEAMEMLKIAYDLKSNDPYIIDSIGLNDSSSTSRSLTFEDTPGIIPRRSFIFPIFFVF